MEYRVIISGRIEYNNSRSITQAAKVIDHLQETRYKGEILFEDSSILDHENLVMVMPRHVKECSEKVWQNTLHMLEQATDYGVAGDVNMWKIQEGKLIQHCLIEPGCEKTTVQAYKRGLRFLEEKGKEEEACAAFSEAITRFDRHAKALERRGYTRFSIKDFDGAIEDYTKSIEVDPKRPDAYLGLANIYISRKNWDAAIENLNACIHHAIPHQPGYLEARWYRGNAFVIKGRFEEALKDYDFVLRRKLPSGHKLIAHRRNIMFCKGKAHAAEGNLKAAIEAFDAAIAIPTKSGKPELAKIFLHRGLAIEKNGQSGFIEDWKQAADYGSKKAAALLAEAI